MPPAATGSVVIVEDDTDLRDLLSAQLEEVGHDVRSSDDGREVLAWLDQDPADVVVVDVAMPKMSGPELLRRIHCLPPARRPEAVVVTAGDVDPDDVIFDGCGRFSFLRKPFLAGTLAREVDEAIGRRRASPP